MENSYQLVSLCEFTTRSRSSFFRFPQMPASPQLPGCLIKWLSLFVNFLLPACHNHATGELPESFRSGACFVAPLHVAVVHTHRKEGTTDSLAWSKTYEVLSFSRLRLSSLGFTNDRVTSLSDKEVERLAERL